MNKTARITIIIICAVILSLSWIAAIRSKTTAERQLELIRQAGALTDDGIYILAVPLLEEAVAYNAVHTIAAEEDLKKAYLSLIKTKGISRKYEALMEKQMNRKNAPADVFSEAALYKLSINARQDALDILKRGIDKTASSGLMTLYERERYEYEINRTVFEDVTAIYNRTMQVLQDGKWGIARDDCTIQIPCVYDKISTYAGDRAVVREGDVIYAVDSTGNRIALAPGGTKDFRNLAENRVALMSADGWRRATGALVPGESVFDDIGMYSGGYAPACSNGRWGVIGINNKWLISAGYDEIIQDELGRCYAQGCVFVRSGSRVYLFSDGEMLEETYQDARPFSDEGYAAVRRNGKWGFIDTAGNVQIGFLYDDALSFAGHLAAVKKDGMWGYVSVSGSIAIDTVFIQAKSFAQGCAPVLTEKGWQIITLIEYKKEKTL